MLDYICKQDVFDVLNKYASEKYDAEINKAIYDIPTADVQPALHGYWIDINSDGIKERKCSNCGKKDNPKTAIKGHYCWNCGTKMEVQPCQPQKA